MVKISDLKKKKIYEKYMSRGKILFNLRRNTEVSGSNPTSIPETQFWQSFPELSVSIFQRLASVGER
jgi:hypothetical protein